jgi:hypothetical protein
MRRYRALSSFSIVRLSRQSACANLRIDFFKGSSVVSLLSAHRSPNHRRSVQEEDMEDPVSHTRRLGLTWE